MQKVHRILVGGVLAACLIAASGLARAQATNKVEADLRDQFGAFAPLTGGRTSLYAFSKQGPPGAKGPNDQVTTSLTSNGVVMAPPASQTLNAPSNNIVVIGKDGKKAIYGPPIAALRNQPKSLIKKLGDIESLQSRSGAYTGLTAQLDLGANAGGRQISSVASVDRGAGPVPPGMAAAAALDPFTVPSESPLDYGVTIGTTLQVTDSSLFGGVEFYALDRTVFTTDAVDNFVEDGSPFEHTLWALSLTANGPIFNKSIVQIDFDLNPDALTEILLPTSYLSSLPGFSMGLSNAQIAALVDAAIESSIGLGLTVNSGVASLVDFSLFPAGTQFQAASDEVVYADGATAVLTAVPEPAALALLGIGIAGLGFSRRQRKQ